MKSELIAQLLFGIEQSNQAETDSAYSTSGHFRDATKMVNIGSSPRRSTVAQLARQFIVCKRLPVLAILHAI